MLLLYYVMLYNPAHAWSRLISESWAWIVLGWETMKEYRGPQALHLGIHLWLHGGVVVSTTLTMMAGESEMISECFLPRLWWAESTKQQSLQKSADKKPCEDKKKKK